jgi:hypothetical protein
MLSAACSAAAKAARACRRPKISPASSETFARSICHIRPNSASGPQAIARRLATNWHDGQNSVLPKPQISGPTPAIPFRQEGRSRVVTNAGWDVVDATASARMAVAGRDEPRERCAGAQDERRFSVRQNCVVLTPQRLASSLAEVLRAQPGGQNHIREATVSNKPDRRGEHGISRKAITQGMPDASAEPVCSCAHPLSHCARDRGCSVHPAFPAPSFEGEPCQDSGATRREIAEVCPL